MSTSSVIKDLVQTLEDGRKGFADAATKLADDGHAELSSRFERLAEQRASFSATLREAASSHGVTVDEDGSIAGALHRGWMGMKDAITGTSAEAIVNAAKSGEDHAVSEYDDALEDDDLPADLAGTVREQRQEIAASRDQLEGMSS